MSLNLISPLSKRLGWCYNLIQDMFSCAETEVPPENEVKTVGCPLIPDRVTASIYDLFPDVLRDAGVRLVLADLDNTLTPYEEALPSPELRRWKEELAQNDITLFVVSNSRKSRRCPDFCQALGIPYVRHAGKPGTKGFREALVQVGIPASQAIMVGDQIFTDIWGGNRAGITTVLVKPMAWGKNPGRILRYAAETPFRLLGKRKKGVSA